MRKANGLFLFMDLLLIVIFIEAVFPPVTLLANPMVINLLCLIAWCVLSFLRDPYFYVDFEKNIKILYPMVFLVISIVVPYIFGNGIIGNRYASLALLPMGYIIFNYYDKHDMLYRLKRILCFVGLFAAATFVRTLVALIENPHICRTIKSGGVHTENLYRQGIAGYSFIYFIAICSVVVLFIAIKEYRTKAFIWYICLYGIMTFFVLKSNYVTALLLVVLCSCVLLFVELSHRKKYGFLLFLGAFAILAIAYQNEIIDAFVHLIPERIADVIVVDSNKSVFASIFDEFMYDRFPTMEASIETYMRNPFGGLVMNEKIGFSGGFLEGFGQHSHVLDTFALYGTFIGIFNVIIMFRPFKNNYGKIIKENISLTISMIVAMLFVFLFNNSTDAIALAITIIYPLIRDSYIAKDTKRNRKERHRI